MSERKRLAAMGAWHEIQLKAYASILNSSPATETEKEAFMGMAIRESNEAQERLAEYYKSMSKREKQRARELLARNAGRKKPAKGPHWCRTCGSTMVPGPFQECQECIEKRYTPQDLQDAIEPFDRKRDPDAV